MTRLGITVYPDLEDPQQTAGYLALAAANGCTRVFTSMFSAEGSSQDLEAVFVPFIQEAHQHGLLVSLDVNPQLFSRLHAAPDNLKPFADMGADILRMDISFGFEKDLQLLKNPYGIAVEFNASVIPASYVEKLIEAGADPEKILVCHNFYPQKYTGLAWESFRKLSSGFQKLGVPVGAFISSQNEETHGVWEAQDGLCTVESMRSMSIDLQMRLMLASGSADDILIGNAFASEEELKSLKDLLNPRPRQTDSRLTAALQALGAGKKDTEKPARILRILPDPDMSPLEQEILFDFYPHTDAGDGSEWLWRDRMPRFVYGQMPVAARPCTRSRFEKGDVLIVNERMPHYSGEIQIVLEPIENDGKRNYLGTLGPGEEKMLPFLAPQDPVIFERLEKE